MAISNTSTSYGSITRGLHWLTALLVLTAIPLGLVANAIPLETDAQVAQKTLLFSLHKTVGIFVFFIALLRILWALTQTHPVPLHPDRKFETFAAATAHWALYGSLVIVPLSGWLHHAATTGFAPIWWPFGQSLPFVPVDFRVAEFFAAWHWLFTKVLAVTLVLHIAGALRHAVVDRDGTLARMVLGHSAGMGQNQASHSHILAAAAIWLIAIFGGIALGLSQREHGSEPVVASTEAGNWEIAEGTVSISIIQLGTEITGSFSDWSAIIDFEPSLDSALKGETSVQIDIASLELGSVSSQARGSDFLDASAFPIATYQGSIVENPSGDGFVVLGILSLKGIDAPVELPFSFRPDGDMARVSGTTTIDRRDFGIGDAVTDEGSLAFPVVVDVEILARTR